MGMIKNTHISFPLILVCLLVVSPMAKAQLGGLGSLFSGLFNIINLSGFLACTVNGNVSANTTSIPPFPNAGVQLVCRGQVVANTTTNNNGLFFFPTNIILPISALINGCKFVVTTPLASCNSSLLDVGSLTSPLGIFGATVAGPLNIFDVLPTGFSLAP